VLNICTAKYYSAQRCYRAR